ncbi:MAG: hypothetical protein AVDCRST_MAG29-701, partial [uncultured Nocardioidaceae bacterium]
GRRHRGVLRLQPVRRPRAVADAIAVEADLGAARAGAAARPHRLADARPTPGHAARRLRRQAAAAGLRPGRRPRVPVEPRAPQAVESRLGRGPASAAGV